MINKQVQRNFILGEEWLYYKVYCGNYSADRILSESIFPIVTQLLDKKLITQWFFIRYNDPENHLRLRFHVNDVNNIQKIIQLTKGYFRELIEKDLVNDIATATYKREIERYGETTIELVENLFYHQSKKTLKLIRNTTTEDDETARIFASLQMINDVLEHFEISLENRISFVKSMEQAYKKEHDIEKENNQKLNQLYRIYKDEIKLFLQEKQEPVYLEGLSKLFKTSKKEIAIIKEILNTKSSISLENLISSIIHMNINRIFRSKQRQYEMLCYDFMTRYYKSIAARR